LNEFYNEISLANGQTIKVENGVLDISFCNKKYSLLTVDFMKLPIKVDCLIGTDITNTGTLIIHNGKQIIFEPSIDF